MYFCELQNILSAEHLKPINNVFREDIILKYFGIIPLSEQLNPRIKSLRAPCIPKGKLSHRVYWGLSPFRVGV